MSVSTSISFNLNARSVIEKALSILGYLPAGETMNQDDAETALLALNMMLKTFQADGCNLWREQPSTVTFAANQMSATLDPRVIDVIEARRVYEDSLNELPLGRWERGQYVSLPSKSQTGVPVAYYPQKNRDGFVLTLWPVPYVETVINFTAARVAADVPGLNDDLDVPQEWLECIVWNLADRLAPVFNVITAAPAIAQRVEQRAQALYSAMRDFDRPGSVVMGR